MSVMGRAADAPGVADGAANENRMREERIEAVRQALTDQLDELESLGLTLPAALLDNAIAEIP